jgi:hypothetical protein
VIRPAKFIDIPALEKILHSTHARSKYAGRTGINQKALEQLLTGLVAGQNQNGPGATFMVVSEQGGEIVGFMAASLNRIYSIGEKLCASDIFLISEASNRADTNKMIDAYIEWASANPKVIEIGLSWSDTVSRGELAKNFYTRRGFTLSGETYTLKRDIAMRKAA